MGDIQAYGTNVKCDNDIEVLSAMIQLYSVSISLRGGKKLRPKLAQLLSYYVKYGYSKETKDLAKDSMYTTSYNITVMNSELDKLSYLLTSNTNFHVKSLNSELQLLANYYKNPGSKKHFVFTVVNTVKSEE